MDRRSAECQRTAKIYIGIFVGKHDAAIVDLDLSMSNGPLRPRHAHDFFCAEYFLVEFNCIGRSLHAQVRRYRVIYLRNRFPLLSLHASFSFTRIRLELTLSVLMEMALTASSHRAAPEYAVLA